MYGFHVELALLPATVGTLAVFFVHTLAQETPRPEEDPSARLGDQTQTRLQTTDSVPPTRLDSRALEGSAKLGGRSSVGDFPPFPPDLFGPERDASARDSARPLDRHAGSWFEQETVLIDSRR